MFVGTCYIQRTVLAGFLFSIVGGRERDTGHAGTCGQGSTF